MDLLLIGVSHRTASVDVRGRVARAAAEVVSQLRVRNAEAITEAFVLSTCHRVEALVVARDLPAAERDLRLALTGTLDDVRGLYLYEGRAAVAHLARVAAGLESMIVGEAEISGQLRRALAAGRASGAVGPYVDRVVAGALRASGRARSETRIAQGVMSAAAAGVALLERAWSSLDGRTVLVIGAGEAGRQALSRLRKRGAARLVVASRSAHHAADAAAKTGATPIALEDVPSTLARVDGTIVATRTTGFLIDRAALRDVAALEIVDLSVPRAVDPAVADRPGVHLHTVDDLGDVARESAARRAREIPRVERIVADEASRTYLQFLARRDRSRTVVA